jgi:outer membrane lipopolysaccharide assembly protein LptE/RlpB
MMKYAKLLLILLCLSLTACGFHFRDSNNTAISPEIKTIYIQDTTNERTGLVFALRQNLQALGITPVSRSTQSPVSLVILVNKFDQTITALGTAQQLNAQVLTYSVTVVLQDKQGKNIGQPTALSTQITFWQNANQILGDTTAIPQLKKNLVHNMAQKILAYLRANDTHKALNNVTTP